MCVAQINSAREALQHALMHEQKGLPASASTILTIGALPDAKSSRAGARCSFALLASPAVWSPAPPAAGWPDAHCAPPCPLRLGQPDRCACAVPPQRWSRSRLR